MAEWVQKGNLKGPQGDPGQDAQLPSGGTTGQVLTKTADGEAWQNSIDSVVVRVLDEGASPSGSFDDGVLTINVPYGVPKMTSYQAVNPGAAAYLAASEDYAARDQSYTVMPEYAPGGSDVPLTYAVPGGSDVTVTDMTTLDTSVILHPRVQNAVPGRSYEYRGGVGGSATGRVTPIGALRMIVLDNPCNFRDLGGWPCDGGSVRYGRMLRGGQIATASGAIATEADIEELYRIGVRAEVNVQGPEVQTPSPLVAAHPDVAYVRVPLTGSGAGLFETERTSFATAVAAVMSHASEGPMAYFHCNGGADRTGAIALVLLSLLGVSHADVDRDYELTSLVQPRLGGSPDAQRLRSESPWPETWQWITDEYGDLPARDACASWLVDSGVGVSFEDVNAFRRSCVDGSPTDVGRVWPVLRSVGDAVYAGPRYVDDGSTLAATVTAPDGKIIVSASVTVGGTDVTSSTASVTGGTMTITIPLVTGAVSIAASTSSPETRDDILASSTDEGGQPFGTGGLLTGHRLNSSGSMIEFADASTSGFMAVSPGDLVEIDGLDVVTEGYPGSYDATSYCYIAFYDSGHSCLASVRGDNFSRPMTYVTDVTLAERSGSPIASFTLAEGTQVAYIRLSCDSGHVAGEHHVWTTG